MPRPRKNSPNLPDAPMINEEAYVTWGDDLGSKKEALKVSSQSLDEYAGIQRATAMNSRYGQDYSKLDTNTDGRPGLTRSDYDFFRPNEAIPKNLKAIIQRAELVYQRVGLVKNVIDLMGDFAVQGVRLVHKNKRIERFYRQWFKKINGKDRSERFLNNLYKTGNVVIKRQTGKLSLKVSEELYKAVASPDLIITDLSELQLEKREIPWRYTFLDPVYVEVAAGPLASFVSKKRYELVLPTTIRRIINSPKTPSEQEIINGLPDELVQAAKTKQPFPLDPDKVLVYHYKKDDWQPWAYPMIYAIMDDITVIEKLKLADISALDGAISNIRIFKLGSLEHKIAPTKAATAKLAQILGNNVGGGTMDLIWGPDIELLESRTTVHQFLGEGKYIPHLNAVYAGLGIPPTLTGTFGAAGTTNNFISLKTLTQRLQYGRDVLISFWEQEIELVRKSMGFKYGAKIEFDRMDLSNEDAEKALLVQLADRNLISDELLQSKFGIDPDMEKSRLNRETRERNSNRMVPKAGPWNDPQFENALKKIALQLGIVTPSQIGLELEKKKKGEQTAIEMKQAVGPVPPTKLANDSPESLPKEAGDGRPKLSKDTEKRKPKKFTPQTGAKLILWASQANEEVSNIINPILLDFYQKKDLRSLSSSEVKNLEAIKTKVLLNTKPFCIISPEIVNASLNEINNDEISSIYNKYQQFLYSLQAEINRPLSFDEQKQVKTAFYSMVYSSDIAE